MDAIYVLLLIIVCGVASPFLLLSTLSYVENIIVYDYSLDICPDGNLNIYPWLSNNTLKQGIN